MHEHTFRTQSGSSVHATNSRSNSRFNIDETQTEPSTTTQTIACVKCVNKSYSFAAHCMHSVCSTHSVALIIFWTIFPVCRLMLEQFPLDFHSIFLSLFSSAMQFRKNIIIIITHIWCIRPHNNNATEKNLWQNSLMTDKYHKLPLL